MKNISVVGKVLSFTLIIAIASLIWAWLGKDVSVATVSRGFFVGGALALLFGFGNLRTSYSFVDQDAPSYSTAFYATLKQRFQLMESDMEEHSNYSLILLGSGLLSLIIGFLIVRFG